MLSSLNEEYISMGNNNVLIIAGDASSRRRISAVLESRGIYSVDTGVAKNALTMLVSGSYDLVYIDLDFLDMDVTYFQQTRSSWPETEIILHDQQPTIERALAGVKLGITAYLVGPINPVEVGAAVTQALVKREEHLLRVTKSLGLVLESYFKFSRSKYEPAKETNGENEKKLIVDDLLLDRAARTLIISGSDNKYIQLTKNETDILAALMSRPGNVLASSDILRLAWGYDTDNIDANAIIRPSISRLRRKLTGAPIAASMIRTVRGVGYMLVPAPPTDTQEENHSN